MTISPIWFEPQRFVYRAPHMRPTIVRNDHDTLEDMNLFCRFLLKCGVKAASKTTPGLDFNARTLTESQTRDDIAFRDDSEQYRPGPLNLKMGSIPVVEGIGVWVLRQKLRDVSVHASTLPESHRPHLQTPG